MTDDDLIRRGDARKMADEVFDRLEKKGADQAAFGAAEVCEAIAALPAQGVDALVKAAEEAAEVVHKAYVSATMEAVNAGPSHPLKDNFDKWRVRCLRAEEALRAALAAIREGRK